ERWGAPELPFRLRHLRVIPHTPPEPAASPLRAGDRLAAVNGRILERDAQAIALLAAEARRGPVQVEVFRGAERRLETLRLGPPESGRRFALVLATLAAVSTFWIGYWVQARRRDPLAKLFFLLTLLIGSLFARDPRLSPGPWAVLLEWKSDLFGLLLPPVWLHFILSFPERRARPLALRLLIYLPPAALALLTGLALIAGLSPRAEASPVRLLQDVSALVSGGFLLLGLAVLIVKAFRRKHRRERRRIQLVLIAALLGLLPLVAFQLLHQALPGRRLGLADWTPLFLTLLPLSFGLGLLGSDLPALYRRAARLRRLLLTGSLLGLLFLLARLGLHLLRPGADAAVEDLALDALALVVALPFVMPLRRRLLRRGQEHGEHSFQDSLRWLAPPRYFTARRELSRALLPRIGWEAESAWTLWLEREGGGSWRVEDRWEGEGGPPASITVPPVGATVSLPTGLEEALLGARCFLAAEQWDPYWAGSLLGPAALPFCKERDWALLLCLGADGERPALLVLGPARRSSLYDTGVVEGLQRLVAPLELHLRNLSLVALASRQERLRSEMELARNIQLSLLPRQMPSLPGLEIVHRMQTSSEVGGDYYDVFELDAGRLGFALGDATGHGVPAAMLISSVALAFRTQAAGGEAPAPVLAAMSQSLGRLIADRARGPGAFAGFFYAQLEREPALLHYCNAGMPAPWLLRRGGRLEQLRRGGQLLGVGDEVPYLQGHLRLRPGDLLFLRSDGLEEQQNSHQEPFGEARLADWLQERKQDDLESLADGLLAELGHFGAGQQTDDISFVFMRIGS
ncbi:hypothetical protein FJ251_12000, partial [bacterium]|nr:hypothetical protein [bacterium]